MKAVLCVRYGGPEALEIRDIPEPVAGKGEVVVKIAAAALNFFDTLIIQGKYQYKPDMPFSPASEFSGTVESVGEGVTGFKPGDRVIGNIPTGAAREKIAVPARALISVPDGLELEKGAGLIVTYGTTIHALKDRAKLKPGETLAVLGASGGVGLAAVELGKVLGAKVIACASSPEKLAFAKQHGADELIDYSKEDLKERLKTLTNGKGVDVIYDPVGGDFAEAALRSIAWEGRFLVIGFAAGEIPKIPLNLALLKGCDIVGVFWGAFAQRNPEANRQHISDIAKWTSEGKLSAHLDAKYKLDDAVEAFRAIAQRKVKGKIVLVP
ncbi:MAG: NADPH:quinone oxidoreductase family protein [Xanthobacteraceae bacterium]|nr:NADPH:quinone oxidoreductase family protein [Xanthobacteraceae bacterium]QYK44922.1 MAG: NADPH:quinone oxidoreductase family protein [Xanthobacteraceae bacterium]